jgi:DNA end-binding protein Ku
MRAIWKGSISFSLVNIPISLYPATRREELKFRLLRKRDLSPIIYKRVAEADGKEVPWEQIVKGYEYEKGQYVVLEDEDFRRADIEATQTVNILEFVALEEIDPVLFDKPYYLEPDKRGAKAYGLLKESLERSGKVGIAKVVIKTRQHLAAVKPEDGALVLELMHFAEELVEPSTLQMPRETEPGTKELAMASELIEKMTDKWKPEKYKDDYRERLLEVIEKKIKLGGRAAAEVPVPKRQPTKVIDLVSVLQQSLQQAGKGAVRSVKPERKHHRKALKRAA